MAKLKSAKSKNKIPKIITQVGFNFSWDSRKVWALTIPTTVMPMHQLSWHLSIPFWEKQHTDDYNLTPNEVMKNPNQHPLHHNKIKRASLKYPIDIMKNKGRWVILDGLHRLTKAYIKGLKEVKVRKIPRRLIPLILSSRNREKNSIRKPPLKKS